MPKSPNDLSTLFRSLGPGTASSQASPAAAAQEAEQRWPLLKALAPKKAAPPPLLSEEDKSRWSTPEPANRAGRKPALSLPGLGDRLTQSLGKMAARPLPRQASAMQAEGHHTPTREMPARMGLEAPARTGLFARAKDEFFAKTPVQVPVVQAPVAQDDSLASLFGRLASVEEPVVPPPPRKSSFLSRIGRR